mmetsp:Transcript_19558/g.30094  ORF Transcript_19558/g.30094 Transcript_19558/m.30094 type:complete len:185 (-) Transcript_19558:123-677(-)|eukprot:CAMPEP_0196809092 /NCGR_PEP_ID=MMETSP1362-20130617/9072_1 /TAXON_ID=163516 /ORGANISM="Leptocylindrus danicus, Strain CCMP1856" /LENGTH=184 /DNA_ID=CAMNT_0042183669 /DNA_START=324 /DNA_END=878 /DNA_ORIENTATION=-
MSSNPQPPYNPASQLPSQSNVNNYNTDQQSRPDVTLSTMGGAAVVGGVAVGAVAGSAILGLAAGVGAAALATQKGTGGDLARATGDLAVATGKKAKELDEKHHIMEQTKKCASSVARDLKKIDKEHRVTENLKKESKNLWDNAKKFDEKHNVSGKTASAMIGGAKYLSKQMTKANDNTKDSSKK